MILDINEKVYGFKFGIGLIRELDSRNAISQNGATFGMGLEIVIPKLLMNDTVALSELLVLANRTETPKVTQKEMDTYFDSQEINMESLFNEVMEELKKSNATRLKVKNILEEAKARLVEQKPMSK